MKKTLLILVLIALGGQGAEAGDWPQFRADASRSGYTSERLSANLSLRWVRRAKQAPRPAWQGHDTRMPFDYAPQPIIGGGMVFFGGSADGKVYALDLATGDARWEYFTESPVRFAPAFRRDRVYVCSDD